MFNYSKSDKKEESKILYDKEYLIIKYYPESERIEYIHKKHIPQKIYEEIELEIKDIVEEYKDKNVVVIMFDRRFESKKIK